MDISYHHVPLIRLQYVAQYKFVLIDWSPAWRAPSILVPVYLLRQTLDTRTLHRAQPIEYTTTILSPLVELWLVYTHFSDFSCCEVETVVAALNKLKLHEYS